jgi:hypothetical protein
MQYDLCRHIKTNGLRCQDAALTEATRGYLIPGQHIELTALEDHEEDRKSVQVSLSVVINALATGQLEIKRATQ